MQGSGAEPGERAREPVEKALVRWCLPLTQPLYPMGARAQAFEALSRILAADEARQVALPIMAGVLHDLVHTLPGPDPWRRIVPGEGFGTWHSGLDLIYAGPGDRTLDIYLAPLVEPLQEASVKLLSTTCHASRGDVQDELWALARSDERWLGTYEDAVRWMCWRRSVYTGPADSFLYDLLVRWVEWADPAGSRSDRAHFLETYRLADFAYDPED